MNMRTLLTMAVALLMQAVLMPGTVASAKEPLMRFYVGTYTGPSSQGIYFVDLDPETGKLSEPVLAAETKNPSFLALHPTQPYLYAALEIGEFEGQKTGAVEAFKIDPASGKLTALNGQSSTGPGPCYVSVDPSGQSVMVANYGGGSVGVLPVGDDGSLKAPSAHDQHTGSGPNPKRQQRAFAHSIVADPSGKFALSCDLGTDEVIIYKLDAKAGTIARIGEAKLAPGTGPRHIAFHPSGKFVFVNGEMANTVTPLTWDAATGTLTALTPVSTLPADFTTPSTTAEIAVHPNGKFVYCSNRGHDSIAVFAFDSANGTLTPIDHTSTQGQSPRHFALDPTGRYLIAANQKSDSLVSFKIDPKTGKLTPVGSTVKVGQACCVRFVKS